jgi:hypothetical protein
MLLNGEIQPGDKVRIRTDKKTGELVFEKPAHVD